MEFLEAVAQSLRNVGMEATATEYYVEVRKIRFEIHVRNSKQFRFCGRWYRAGNAATAVVDLLLELPRLEKERQRLLEARRQEAEIAALNKGLEGRGLSIKKLHNNTYELTYKSDLERIRLVADQIAKEQDIKFAQVDEALAKLSVTFTSEGGFSLN